MLSSKKKNKNKKNYLYLKLNIEELTKTVPRKVLIIKCGGAVVFTKFVLNLLRQHTVYTIKRERKKRALV